MEVFQRVDVEKWVVGRHAPIRVGADMAREEAIDAAQILDDERLAQIRAERDRPKCEGRMDDIVGARDGNFRRLGAPRRMEPRDEVGRQKGRIGRHAHRKSKIGVLRGEIIEPRQNAGQRPWKIRHVIRHDRDCERRKPRRIAIGVDHDRAALRLKSRDHMRHERLVAKLLQRLVGAAHPRRAAAGENDGAGRRIGCVLLRGHVPG